MSREAMEKALDCLLYYNRREAYPRPESPTSKTIEALRAALAESAGAEPVAWRLKHDPWGPGEWRISFSEKPGWEPLYTHPPAREAELSDEEIIRMWHGSVDFPIPEIREVVTFARAVLAARGRG